MPAEADRVLVAGAGLAGLTVAFRLSEAGVPVTLLEKRPHAGGRVYSFEDPETGDTVDNGQHVYLGCCDELIELLQDAGGSPEEHLQDRLELVFRDRGGNSYRLREAFWLPFPLCLLPMLTSASFLSWSERWSVATCFNAVRALGDEDLDALEDRSMGSWLRENGQSDRSIRRFWNTLIVSTLNAGADRVSAASGLFVLKNGLLASRNAGRIGVANRGQTPFYVDPLVDGIRERGGRIRFGASVRGLRYEENRCAGVETTDGPVSGRVVLAVPPWALGGVIEEGMVPDLVREGLEQFEPAPIVCVNVWVDQNVMEEPFVALLEGTFDWSFNRNRIEGRTASRPQHLSLVKSAAFDELDRSVDELRRRARDDLSTFFGVESLERVKVTKEPRATFVPSPGLTPHRPGVDPPVDGLYLAGAWTNTGWPSTMESAVRSGNDVASRIETSQDPP